MQSATSSIFGVKEPSKIKLGEEWREHPKWVLDTPETTYRFYRDLRHYSNTRVTSFVCREQMRVNLETGINPDTHTGWAEQAGRVYHYIFNACKTQLEKAKK